MAVKGKKDYPCEGKLRQKIEEFYRLCDRFKLTYPDIEQSKDGDIMTFTSPGVVRLTEDADIPHVFGHFLCEYHYIEPDVVADVISKMINDSNSRTVLDDPVQEAFQHNLGLYR